VQAAIPEPAARRWLFADQLGPHFLDAPGQPVLLIESRAAFGRGPVHRQRAHLVLSALRHRAAELGGQDTLVRARTYREALATVDGELTVCGPTSMAARRVAAGGPPRVAGSAPCPGISARRSGCWCRR
jgi:deoxyribodipyrimidine photolyase-related protein